MRILTYKRTHIGDPDSNGYFGINGCMGQVRSYNFDAVIGVGGIGHEPRSHGIDRKINWVGCKPRRQRNLKYGGILVKFEKFILLENLGPALHDMAPQLARRMYQVGARILLTNYSDVEQAEAESIIQWLLRQRATKPKRLKLARKSSNCIRKCRSRVKARVRCSPNLTVKRDCANTPSRSHLPQR